MKKQNLQRELTPHPLGPISNEFINVAQPSLQLLASDTHMFIGSLTTIGWLLIPVAEGREVFQRAQVSSSPLLRWAD